MRGRAAGTGDRRHLVGRYRRLLLAGHPEPVRRQRQSASTRGWRSDRTCRARHTDRKLIMQYLGKYSFLCLATSLLAGCGMFATSPSSPKTSPVPSYDRVAAIRAAGRSEEHTSELQSLMRISYAVFCLKKKT